MDLVMLPKQFETYYIDKGGSKKMPWVIHRAIFGSFERFIGMLLEHTDGKLPVWLSPVQAEILSVGEAHQKYAKSIGRKLTKSGVRTTISLEDTLGKRIRGAELKRVPYVVVVGDKEMQNKTVNVRHYQEERTGEMPLAVLIKKIKAEIKNRQA